MKIDPECLSTISSKTTMPKSVLSRVTKPTYVLGDLWEFHKRGFWVVVTTNIGWKANGDNVMGAGVALQAARKFPQLPRYYGRLCKKYKDMLGVVIYDEGRLILAPTKRLDWKKPHLSWQAEADIGLVEQTIHQLAELAREERFKIAMSYPGCGNGGLSPREVKPLLDRYLSSRFVVVSKRSV